MDHRNLPTAHRAVAGRFGPRPALRYRKYGLYRDLSWSDYRRQADEAAAGLIALGIGPGDAVAVLSENRHEWLVADIAILTAGAVGVPLHAPLAPPQVEYQLRHSRAKAVLVSTQAQADKVMAVRDSLPDLSILVTFDPVDLDDRIARRSWDGLKQLGATDPAAMAEALRRESGPVPDDLATIIYTSGTTGHPKGVMLSHGNLLSNAGASCLLLGVGPAEVALSWLPYSHIYARTCDHYATLLAGATLCLGSMETLLGDFVEARATRMNSVPRFYEKVWTAVEALEPADRARRLRDAFGPAVRMLSSGGAPLPRHVADGFIEAGLPLLEGYGLTESSPVISFNEPNAHRAGTVGRAIPGVEVRIADDGEILTRGPHVMLGYWEDPEATRSTVVDGWLHTGDVGTIDADGYLTITDRKKDLIITSGGKNIAPGELERLLAADPYIDQVVVHGDRKPFVSALIVPNFPAIEAKAAELGCGVEVEDEMIVSGPLLAFFADRVERIMQAVSQPERVRAFLLLARPFRVDAEELTATLKVRRRHILRAYEGKLEALYARPGLKEC